MNQDRGSLTHDLRMEHHEASSSSGSDGVWITAQHLADTGRDCCSLSNWHLKERMQIGFGDG